MSQSLEGPIGTLQDPRKASVSLPEPIPGPIGRLCLPKAASSQDSDHRPEPVVAERSVSTASTVPCQHLQVKLPTLWKMAIEIGDFCIENGVLL